MRNFHPVLSSTLSARSRTSKKNSTKKVVEDTTEDKENTEQE